MSSPYGQESGPLSPSRLYESRYVRAGLMLGAVATAVATAAVFRGKEASATTAKRPVPVHVLRGINPAHVIDKSGKHSVQEEFAIRENAAEWSKLHPEVKKIIIEELSAHKQAGRYAGDASIEVTKASGAVEELEAKNAHLIAQQPNNALNAEFIAEHDALQKYH